MPHECVLLDACQVNDSSNEAAVAVATAAAGQIGLGIVHQQDTSSKQRRQSPPGNLTLPEAMLLSPVHMDQAMRPIYPLPSPSSIEPTPTFEKHMVLSPPHRAASKLGHDHMLRHYQHHNTHHRRHRHRHTRSSPAIFHPLITPTPTPPANTSNNANPLDDLQNHMAMDIPVDAANDNDMKDEHHIPILALSPSLDSEQQARMPNLAELPILGDLDDSDHYFDQSPNVMPPLTMSGELPDDDASLVVTPSYDETQLIGKCIWKFRILRLLGAGAFASVYLALDTDTGDKTSAIKMIRKENMLQNLRVKSSIEREVAVLQHLHHPGIVRLQATMEIEHHVCLVLEYVEGGELFDFVQEKRMLDVNGNVDEPLVRGLFVQLADVVQWMHTQNVVHRDLKIENVLLSTDDNGQATLKITDFGLARVIDPAQPMLTTRCGSEEYAAPEIVQGIGYDGRKTDTWALGIILYALLVASLPFKSKNGSSSVTHLFYQIMEATLRWPKTLALSDAAKQVVQALLMRRPEQRIALADLPQLPWFL